jgi:hypothetical protein
MGNNHLMGSASVPATFKLERLSLLKSLSGLGIGLAIATDDF